MALPSRLATPMISDASLKAIAGLAPFAEGDILVATGPNAFAKVAKGTAGQVLRRNLAGDGYEFVSIAAGGWVTIASDTLSDVASWSKTDLSAYRKLRITGFIRCATDGAYTRLRTSTDNGSSYDAGATDYRRQHLRGVSTTADAFLDADDDSIAFSFVSIGNTTTEEGVQFEILIDQFNQTTRTWVMARANVTNTSGAINIVETAGHRLADTACNALQIDMSSGNISFGQILLEGLVS